MTMGTRITGDDLRRLLSERKIFPDLPEWLAEDTTIALDSMGMIWLLHQLAEQYDLRVDPTDAELAEFTSVGNIIAYLDRTVTHGT